MTVTDTTADTAGGTLLTGRHGWLVPAGLALALVALLGGMLLGRGTAAAEETDISDEVSLGFLRDMKVHHAQAVEMSEVVHRRSADPQLSYLAFDILSTQQGQIGIMRGWLDLSREPQSASGPTMGWMSHSGPMPGLAGDEQIAALDALPVPEMEEQFLRLMIDHHRGALDMAEHAAEHADSGDVARLAQGMHDGQASEIDLMQDLLAARGAAPQPEPDDAAPAPAHEGH